MYSPKEIQSQREATLVKKIEYLREEAMLMEMTIMDFKLRTNIVADIRAAIKRAGMELGGHPENDKPQHRPGTLDAALIVTEGEDGC